MVRLRFEIVRARIRGRRVNRAHQWRRDLHLFRMDFPASHGGISAEEHTRIVAAVVRRDPDAAEKAMEHHLTAARARHLPFFDRGTA